MTADDTKICEMIYGGYSMGSKMFMRLEGVELAEENRIIDKWNGY
jgi:hypothetical protein